MEITDEQYLQQIILSFIFTYFKHVGVEFLVDYKLRTFVSTVSRINILPVLFYILVLFIPAQQLIEIQ